MLNTNLPHSNVNHYLCVSAGSADAGEPSEAPVRGDGAKCGAEDCRGSGKCQESQGTSFTNTFTIAAGFLLQASTSVVPNLLMGRESIASA